jgi:septal ring-binding cell division protein DamX
LAAGPRLPTITEATRTEGPGVHAEAPPENRCAYCGAHMAIDQEWCLECGSARTLIHRSPNWRIPIAIVGGIVLLALVAFAIALVGLSAQTSRTAQTQSTASKPTTTAASAKPKPQLAVASWPTGVSGWTVQLAQRRFRYKAFATARRFAQGDVHTGVLNSSDHPTMTPGYWIVFDGRYPDRTTAQDAALKLRKGYPSAHPVRVAPPGGI